jgi:hypothetical protein
MKKLLLISLLSASCELADKQNKPPTPIPTATPDIGTAPTLPTPANRCAPHAPLKSCKSAKFGDGKGGTLFKRSDTNPNNYAFLLSGDIRNFEAVTVCTAQRCDSLPYDACANPDHIGERAHYKGPLKLDPKKKWVVKFGECELEIKNNERTD